MRLPDVRANVRDWLLCGAVALCAVALGGALWFSSPGDGAVAVVTQDGTELARLPLDTDATYTVGGPYENVVRVADGKVSIESATCPGEDCVRQGAVSRVGASLVCLPNRVTVTVEGADGTTDVVIG